MSIHLDPSLEIRKSVEITKYLRSRDVQLTSLLPLALEILDGGKLKEWNTYFPQKEDWLLEWLVQRLREDGALDARRDPKFWKFLLYLLPLSPSAGKILKKHNLLQLVSKTFSEAASLSMGAAAVAADQNVDTEIEGEEIYSTPKERPSSPSSNSTEHGLPVERASSKLQSLLESISAVLLYLQENIGACKSGGNTTTVLRGVPDVGAQILGSYLEVCRVLLRDEIDMKEEWMNAVLNVWQGCVWGIPNLKKLSIIFSTSCLVPATRILAEPLVSSDLRYKLEQLVCEFIFSQEVLFPTAPGGKPSKPSSKDLKPLLEPLTIQKESLPHLLRIAIKSQTGKRRPDPDTVETIFESIITLIPGISFPSGAVDDLDAEIIRGLLAVLVETGTMVSSNTLAMLVDGISHISYSNTNIIRWDIIEVSLKLDFDIFLAKGNEARALKLMEKLTKSNQGELIVYKVLELLIDSFVKARNLEGFVKAWVSELAKDGSRGGIWESDKVGRLFSERIEDALLPGQVEKILRAAIQERNWVVIDAILKGVRREDTEDKIRGLLSKISEIVLESDTGWRGWRALVRALQIENGLVGAKQENLLKRMKKPTEGGLGDQAREKLFIGEVLMDSVDIEGQAEVLSAGIKEMRCATKDWDGSMENISQENLGVIQVMGFISRWMGVIERVPVDIRVEFVNEFLNMAINSVGANESRNFTSRIVWQGMLAKGISYEYPVLKDAILSALIKKLETCLSISGDISTSLANIQEGRGTAINKYDLDCCDFILESIAKYPLEAVRRTSRERILDAILLLDTALEEEGLHIIIRERVKSLFERLWTLGNASSFLATSASGFLTWSLGEGRENVERRILRCAFATKEQERSRGFLKSLIELAESELLSGKPNIKLAKACEIITGEFWRAGEGSEVKKLRENILDQLHKSIEAGEMNGDVVGAWRKIWVLDRESRDEKEALELAQYIIENVKTALPIILGATEHMEKGAWVEETARVVAETIMLLCACTRTTDEAVNTTALVVGMLDSSFAKYYRSEITISYRGMVSDNLDLDAYLKCVEVVVEGCFALINDGVMGPGYWETLKVLIDGAKKPGAEESSKRMTYCLSTVFSRLARNLPKVKTVAEFLAVAGCMDAILREKTWAVMQYNIDETLASVAIMSSPSGPQFPLITINADEIFLQLCSLLRLVLLLHRRRVRGSRYHLVIAALKSLLHCIYKRKTARERKKSEKTVHPPWLLPSKQPCSNNPAIMSKTPAITRKCADSFNRLLMTFCEPSASSVRNRKKTDDNLVYSLRDHEKREVASCAGSLLGEILKGSLEGGFDGDITISINAIFEVLGAEGVKGFAKTVNREGRAMLRELWDEYNRVGGRASERL